MGRPVALYALFVALACAATTTEARDVRVGARTYPEPFVVPPPHGGETNAVVVMLHGLGGGADGWKSITQEIPFDGVRWVFPNAPSISVRLDGGAREPAWYDMTNTASSQRWDDEVGILESADYVVSILRGLVAEGIPGSKIILGGFSQGGAVALTTALHSAGLHLAGCFSLSGYLPMHEKYYTGELRMTRTARDIPIFLAHGTADPVFPSEFGPDTKRQLRTLGMKSVAFQSFPGLGHERREDVVRALATFIASVL